MNDVKEEREGRTIRKRREKEQAEERTVDTDPPLIAAIPTTTSGGSGLLSVGLEERRTTSKDHR